ncbi:MAG TPA: hypothetical protein VNS58_18850 [Puia sp.]|nr:hypothetical protein [Puia sp.]
MKIYEIKPELDKIQNILPVDENDYALLDFAGQPKLSGWEPINFYIFNPLRKKANFFILASNSGALVMDELAMYELSSYFGLAGELLPIILEDGTKLYILNVVEVANSLNKEKTEFDYYDDGTRGRILKPIFHDNRFPESSIFKIPETVKTTVLTYSGVKDPNDEFITAYKQSGLTGLIFNELYSNE